MPVTLVFTSSLDRSHLEELEELMFFHPQQGRFKGTLLDSVEEFGQPHILDRDGLLHVGLGGDGAGAQTLYAMVDHPSRGELAGVVVYTRTADNELLILHIAVKDRYTSHGRSADAQVTYLLIEELRQIARRIHGIRGVRIAYKRGHSLLNVVRPVLPAEPTV